MLFSLFFDLVLLKECRKGWPAFCLRYLRNAFFLFFACLTGKKRKERKKKKEMYVFFLGRKAERAFKVFVTSIKQFCSADGWHVFLRRKALDVKCLDGEELPPEWERKKENEGFLFRWKIISIFGNAFTPWRWAAVNHEQRTRTPNSDEGVELILRFYFVVRNFFSKQNCV